MRPLTWNPGSAPVIVSVLSSSAVDRGFEPRPGQYNWYLVFSAKHAALRRKSKYWLARNQDNVSEWGDISIDALLFQWASTIKKNTSKRVGLEQSGSHHHFIENLFSRHDLAEKLLNNHSFTHWIFIDFLPINIFSGKKTRHVNVINKNIWFSGNMSYFC